MTMTYRLVYHTALLSADEYMGRYRDAARFLPLCEACPRYGNCWACPPYEYDPAERIAGYRYIHLLGVQIVVTGSDGGVANVSGRPGPGIPGGVPGGAEVPAWKAFPGAGDDQKGLPAGEWAERVLAAVRSRLDFRLLALERQYPGSRALFAGTCSGCPAGVCPRACGEPCIRPESVRPSLEAYGFDVAGSAAELLHVPLLWPEEGQRPDYLMLVSGFLADSAVPGFAARFA